MQFKTLMSSHNFVQFHPTCNYEMRIPFVMISNLILYNVSPSGSHLPFHNASVETYLCDMWKIMHIMNDNIPLGDIIAQYSTSKAITPDLPIEEPDNSLSMGDEHLNTTPSIENLIPIPNRPLFYERSPLKLAHVALIPQGIVEADFYPNDDTSSNDDSFEYIKYVDATPSYSELVNDVDQEEKEFD
ncbi:hypothetical protein Tco_0488258 [Tanacetum coccineum]